MEAAISAALGDAGATVVEAASPADVLPSLLRDALVKAARGAVTSIRRRQGT